MAIRSMPERGIGLLISDVSRLLRRNLDRRLHSLGLTQAQWRALAFLAREEGMKQAALAERLEVAPITLARLIDRMEAAGWVERRADPADRRASQLYLTARCTPVLEAMHERAGATLVEALAGVAPADRQRLRAALERVKLNLIEADTRSRAARNTPEVESHGRRSKTTVNRRGR